MTFSLRRKRPTTLHAPITSATTATSAILIWLLVVAGVEAQPALPPAPGFDAPAQKPPARLQQRGMLLVQDDDTLSFPRPGRVVRTGAQMSGRGRDTEDELFNVPVELPDPGRLYRRDSEAQLFERIRQEARKRPGSTRVIFPQEPIVGKTPYQGRHFPRLVELVEPGYVCHRRLLFEQKNMERALWDLGPVQPGVQLLVFYYDVALLPYHLWTRPCDKTDCSAGKCLPGDPVPFLLYPEEFSLTGLVAEASTIVGGAFIFH